MRRCLAALILLTALAVTAALCSIAFGTRVVGIGEIVGGLSGSRTDIGALVVAERLPRTAVALVAGAALGVSGALMQAVTRNPIADPGILGVNIGASLAILIGVAFLDISGASQFLWFALIGATLTAVFVYAIGSLGPGGPTPVKLALAGVATSAVLSCAISAVMLPRAQGLDDYRFWQMGSLGRGNWNSLTTIAPFLAVATVLALLVAGPLNSLALGEEMAIGLGVNVTRTRLAAASAGVLLCSAVTAVIGPIGFVGLMVPHTVRMLCGPDHRWLLPLSALCGADLLTLSDVVGRVVSRPSAALPVAVVTAFIGAPILIMIVRGTKVRELMSTPSITEATTSAPNIQSLHPGFSIAGRRRRTLRFAAVTIALALTAAALWVAMILVGETWYSPDEVLAVLSGDIVPGASFDVGEIRLPRAIIGLLAGMAFGMAGTTSQTMLRNQLASPDIIGITSGASASAVFAILVLGWSPAGIGVNILAIACGLGTALTIFRPSGQGRSQGGRLILIGIGVSAMFTSLISYLQLQGNVYKAIEAMRWLSGSLDSVSWNQVPVLAAAMAVCGALLLVIGRDLGPLTLGEETATGLGVPVNRARLALVITMVALSAFATAATGPIAFVSFLAGPMAARLIGQTDHSLLVPAALMGAVIVLGCDLVAQCFLSAALPVGVVTGLMGAPYLISQLIRINRQGASA